MPGHLIPKKSGVHRVACFALYRALLRQRFKLPVPEKQRRQYERQVKTRTRENARLQGHWHITTALRLGYETLEAVRNDSRRPMILQRIAELSAPPPRHFPKHDKKPPRPSNARSKPPPSPAPSNQPPSLNSPVLDRPYSKLSARRHVPILVNANRFPMLRIRKPQSPLLSALIRYNTRLREQRIMRSEVLSKITMIGKDEDNWDWILAREFGIEEEGPSWKEESARAHNRVRELHEAALRKRVRISKEMTLIVEKEKVLAQEERVKSRKKKDLRRRMKYLIRHGREEEAKALAEQEGIDAVVYVEQCGPVEDEEQGFLPEPEAEQHAAIFAQSRPSDDTKGPLPTSEPATKPKITAPPNSSRTTSTKDLTTPHLPPSPKEKPARIRKISIETSQPETDPSLSQAQTKTRPKPTPLRKEFREALDKDSNTAIAAKASAETAEPRAGLPLRNLTGLTLEEAMGED